MINEPFGREFSRRSFLGRGGAVAAAGALAPWVDPFEAYGATKWPKGALSARDAVRVKDSQFMPLGQFRRWQAELDKIGPANQKGLRATGSPAHENYIGDLRDDLARAGVRNLTFEPVPFERWTTAKWSLDVLSGTGAGPIKTASYIPYGGQTPAGGVTGELVFVDNATTPAPGSLAGKIVVFDVPLTVVPITFFTGLSYPNAQYDPRGELVDGTYKRPYLNGVVPRLEVFDAAGAAGVVGILDYPASGADGSYFPYNGIIREVPGVYVDRPTGAKLKQIAGSGAQARLAVPATIKKVRSRNLFGFIPGRSSEIVTLHCHTDGSNAIEDNAPAAMVAMAQYMARLPRKALPRTVMILLTTGHFAGGNGATAFLKRHEDDLVKRTNAALTIEHLGLREFNEPYGGGEMAPTGRFEPGAIFAPGSPALVTQSLRALKRARAAPSGVLRPLNPEAPGDPEDAAWPGEGQYLFAKGGIPTANYITGPTYLLNWGITTTDKVSFPRVRAEAIAFTEQILSLGRTARKPLRTYDLATGTPPAPEVPA